MSDGRRRRRGWSVALRAVLGLGLIAFVLTRPDWDRLLEALRSPSWPWLGAAVALFLASNVAWSVRWHDILRAAGARRRYRDLLALVFVGQFFNTFLPTSAGGDLVRGWYASDGRSGLVTSYAVVLVERAVGLVTLGAVAATAAVVALASPVDALPPALLWTVGGAGATLVAVGAVAFLWPGTGRIVRRTLGRRERWEDAAAGLASALSLFREPDVPRLRIWAASGCLQVLGVLFQLACARTAGVEVGSLLFFLVVPVAVVASMIPVSVNGLGVREGVLVGLLSTIGGDPATLGAYVVVALVVSTLLSCVGGVLYPFYRPSEGLGRASV